jgi:hypothetical protein
MKMLQLALLNRVPFGKFNRASAFPVACCGVSERTTIKWIHSFISKIPCSWLQGASIAADLRTSDLSIV